MIRFIVFDLGGVVLTNDWHFECQEKFRAYEDYFKVTEESMENAWNRAYSLYKVGKVDEGQFWKMFLEIAGAKTIDVAKAEQLWRQYQFEIGGMLSLLARLKRTHRLAALTNIGKEWLDWKVKRFNLDSYFETIVSSCHSGIAKPDRGIYEVLLQKLGVKPSECLFVDDKAENIRAAEQLGIKGILFEGKEKLEQELDRLLLH